MDIPASYGISTSGITKYGISKYDLGEKSRGRNEASPPRPCLFFFSGHCRAGNRCSHSHNYQTLDKFNDNKSDHRQRMDCRVYIVPSEEGSRQSGTVYGPNIAASLSSEYKSVTDSEHVPVTERKYDPVTDSLDLVNSIVREEKAKLALTSELPPTDNLLAVALHETDSKDAELKAVNVKSRQSHEKEQSADCKDEKQNIWKAGGIKEGKDGSKVAGNEGDTDGKRFSAFRCVLVEFVKELLSPTWKEKKIKEEVYRTIVKKVERKVISSFRSSTKIPRTQEDINNYLAASERKISNLVQAYIKEMAKANVA
ncbi:uncharacterized protein LOC141712348 [Apium graveolens]|uniref:uncharacterized protein LOC141712348 n=1 Tax=Apium graveolens TaxID=4045 RepID=UPI003D7BE170